MVYKQVQHVPGTPPSSPLPAYPAPQTRCLPPSQALSKYLLLPEECSPEPRLLCPATQAKTACLMSGSVGHPADMCHELIFGKFCSEHTHMMYRQMPAMMQSVHQCYSTAVRYNKNRQHTGSWLVARLAQAPSCRQDAGSSRKQMQTRCKCMATNI